MICFCELRSDRGCGCLIPLGVLFVELHVQAGVGKRLLKAFACSIERGVSGDLADAD